MITNRGVKVWPEGFPETFCTDHWRCRFQGSEDLLSQDIVNLVQNIASSGLDFVKTEHLYAFDGEAGYSLGQGQ
jgi:isocitrate dehydrogenase